MKKDTKKEIIFIVEPAPEGGYTAKALGESIFTEADTLDDLHSKVKEAVQCHFEENTAPQFIRLHHVHDELIAI